MMVYNLISANSVLVRTQLQEISLVCVCTVGQIFHAKFSSVGLCHLVSCSRLSKKYVNKSVRPKCTAPPYASRQRLQSAGGKNKADFNNRKVLTYVRSILIIKS